MNSEDVRNDPRMKAHWNKLARDRWKAEAMAWRTCLMHGNRGQPIETYEAWKSARAANGGEA